MKLKSLSGKLLKLISKEYKDNKSTDFSFNFFKSHFPDVDDDTLSNALYLLQNEGFITIMPADNVAYISMLNYNNIHNIEEDTLLKKGYEWAKEIRSWFP